MDDEFTIKQIRETIKRRIDIIEGVREGYVNAQFRGGFKDAQMIQWLLDRLKKTETDRDTLQARVAELEAALDQFPEDWRARADGMRGPFKMQKAWYDGFNAARAALAKDPTP